MTHELPSFLEDHISQIPALQLLQNLGWDYLTPGETVSLRGGKLSGVILDVQTGFHLDTAPQIVFETQFVFGLALTRIGQEGQSQ